MRTLLLLLLCSFPFLSATAQEEVFVDGIRYELSEEGAVVVVGYYGGEKVVIPDTITYLDAEFKEQRVAVIGIGRDAFYGCTNLTEITIPGSVTSIGEDAFAGCTGLTEITIPGSVTSSGLLAFMDCTGLTKITIPGSVTSIGNSAFSDCTGLTEITIPSSVRSIGYRAFSGCDSLRTVVCKSEVPPMLVGTFDEATIGTAKLVVPEESISAYKAALGWKDFRNIESLTAIRKVSSGEPEVKAVYSADGVKLSKPQKGINIVVGKDGKSKKVLVR